MSKSVMIYAMAFTLGMTPNDLLNVAKCYAQCIPEGMYKAAMISVLIGGPPTT